MVGDIERCPTGIEGFDKLCKGGFVRNSDNVIVGGPGSGKTTFLLQFLWNGVTKFNENGIYCSFEPDIADTMNDAASYGWDFSKLAGEGRIKFLKFSPETDIAELKSQLTKMISQGNIQRICFDPISVLALNLNESGKIREAIYSLSSLMKRLKVTSVLADESMEAEGIGGATAGEWTKTDIIRFLSDSVTMFYESGITGGEDRAIRIMKMRRTAHVRAPVGMKIEDKGIKVFGGINANLVSETTPTISEEETLPQNIASESVVT